MSFLTEFPKEARHTLDRLKERYEIEYVDKLYTQLCLQVTKGRTELIGEEPDNNQEIHMTKLYPFGQDYVKVYMVWCKTRKCITTVLPPEGFHAETRSNRAPE